MIYRVKEKFWTWGKDFTIMDARGQPRFLVDGEPFSWGKKLSFQDMAGKELAFISQKLMSWRPRYQILRNGAVFAEVAKEATWFKKRFRLDVPGPNDYQIDGSFWRHEFAFTASGRQVATVSKKAWSWAHEYGVDILEGEDEAAILCTCIIIDLVLHDEKNH